MEVVKSGQEALVVALCAGMLAAWLGRKPGAGRGAG